MGKRKSNPTSKRDSRIDFFALGDPRKNEKELAYLERCTGGKPEISVEEKSRLLDDFFKGNFAEEYLSGLSAAQCAQDKAYDAFAASGKNNRIKMAKAALAISDDCADAYLILAEDEAQTVEDAIPLLRQGQEGAKRVIGAETFVSRKGDFSRHPSTRTYLRTIFSLAECLAITDNHEEAIALYKEILELDVTDYYLVKSALPPVMVAAQEVR